MKSHHRNIHFDGKDLYVVYTYTAGRPETQYKPNGDPGDPAEPSEIEITSIRYYGSNVLQAMDDATYERLYNRVLELHEKGIEDDSD